ncbi:hypothetical protein PF005_g24952 [Phytophthora fragariae]|uniref:Uncharacterized protein n=1 Tax=Phytophthora fragariae TaxID=53985 RepID=A0A6A3RI80_9STRA|nr:hypothetical protein PF003_g38660 [Phytophthora fragariae]KAE8924234.1 hypothetical protein PF009_g25531 [Phytophthora fragariae]KAE8981491.1 hypothetical protein PF011_g21999 [Phytophthora fragariae]KAE9080865.1 hypothetical protein PF007_g22871 [Phytophthora fragariae]KAE9083325.1 hypothetical protein PF010_g21256 [Phytophthora fragariae]
MSFSPCRSVQLLFQMLPASCVWTLVKAQSPTRLGVGGPLSRSLSMSPSSSS